MDDDSEDDQSERRYPKFTEEQRDRFLDDWKQEIEEDKLLKANPITPSIQ
jgi:hypothetical protein